MELLKVSEVYGAKCNILKKDICISTRSCNQTNSNVTLTAKKPITYLKLMLDNIPEYFFEMEVSILTKDGKIKQAGTLTNNSSFVNIFLKDSLIEKIIFTMKNTTKEERKFTLKSFVA